MKLHLARNTKLLIAEDQVLAKSHMHYALEQLGFKNMNYASSSSVGTLRLIKTFIICFIPKSAWFNFQNSLT